MRSSCCEGVSISPASSQWFLGPTATADPGTAGWSLLKHTHKQHHFGLKFCKVILQCGIIKTCTIFLALAIVLFDVAGTWCKDTAILEIIINANIARHFTHALLKKVLIAKHFMNTTTSIYQ